MDHIQIVGELDVNNSAQLAGLNESLEALVSWCIAVIEGDPDLSAASLFRSLNLPDLLAINDHRFFHNYIATGLQPGDGVFTVSGIRPGHKQHIRSGFPEHLSQGCRRIKRNLEVKPIQECGHPAGINIENSNQLRPVIEIRPPVRILAKNWQNKVVNPSKTQPTDHITSLFHKRL